MEQTPIIIVEGPGFCGRSDVASGIARHFGFKLFKGGGTAAEFVQAMQPALDRERGIVIDGGWHMEIIAASAQRRRSRITPIHRRMLTRLALARAGTVVKVMTSLRTYMMNASYKGSLIPENVDLLFNAYEEWENLDPLLPYHDCNPHTMAVFETLWPRLEADMKFGNPGPGIGSYSHHRVMLVGDRHGRSLQPYNVKLNVPFVSMSGVGCSEWLTQELIWAHICECDLYWINAYDQDGNETDPDFMYSEQMPTIAMGGAAEQWCMRHNLNYQRVPHPQYWKRFHYDDDYPFIGLLKDMIVNG